MGSYATRDIAIMRLIVEDWSYQEIAEELGVSTWTIFSRVRALSRLLCTHSRKETALRVLGDLGHDRPVQALPMPSERQLACLKLAMAGLSNKEIGRQLGITIQTVKGHLSELYELIGAVDRCHAGVIAVVAGWVSESELREFAQSYYRTGALRRRQHVK